MCAPLMFHSSSSTVWPFEQCLHEADGALRVGAPVPHVLAHGREPVAVTCADLDDERSRRQRRQGPDLLGHEHGVPEGGQEQAAGRPLVPRPEDAAEQGHVRQEEVRAGGVVVADGEAVQPRPRRRLGLRQHRPGRSGRLSRSEGGSEGCADSHARPSSRAGSDRGSPNHGSTLSSKRVMARIRPPVRVST
jgi:hypothetical protein